MNKYVFAYLGFSLVSLLYSPNLVSGITYISVSFALFVFFLIVVNFIKSDLHLKAIVVTLLLMNILITILLVYQFIKGDFIQGVMDATVNTGGFKFYRAVGTFSDPNVAATFMATGVILAFSLLIHSKDRLIIKLFYLAGSLFSILGIIITFSRSGWIFLAVGIIVSLFFIYDKKKLVVIILFLSLMVILTTFTTPLGELISDRFLSIFELFKDPSIKARILMGESGFRMFLDSPIWGFGYRSFPFVYDYYINPDMPWESLYIRESHTLFIYLLAELGVIGFVIVFLWFRRVLIDCFRFIRVDKNRFTRAILIGSFSLFIAFNVNFLFYGNLFPQFNLIWLNFGLIYSVILKERTTLLNQSSI
jgi:O-antigen ligase